MLGQSGVYAQTPAPEPSIFDVRFLRVEGASVGLRRAADTVYEVGIKSHDSSRLGYIAALRSAADDLRTETTATALALDALQAELPAPRGEKNPSD